MALTHRIFKGHHQTKGQSLFNGVSFGAGGALGSLYAGHIWDWPVKGARKDIWAVTVQANWRVTFRFENGDAEIVNYEDYH